MSLNLLRTASNKVAFVVPTPKSVSALFSKNSFSTVMAGMTSAAVAVDELISFVSSRVVLMLRNADHAAHECLKLA